MIWIQKLPHSFNAQRASAQYLRERFMQYSQSDMGHLALESRHVHLYINGLYWGLYLLTERPSGSYMSEELGGDKEDYDVLNSGDVVNGDLMAWDAMMDIAESGLDQESNYLAIQDYLDIDNFIDYMILNHWAGNMDWDHHNWYAGRERKTGAGYQFFIWDAERTLENVSTDIIDLSNDNNGSFVFQQLRKNEAFRIRFADRLQKHFFEEGALRSEAVIDRWNFNYNKIDLAIIAESARWGDYRRDVEPIEEECPCILLDVNEEYMAERNRLLNDYFPLRSDIVLEQYRDENLYPDLDAVEFSEFGGTVNTNTQITLSNPNNTGDIYYTTDGSDPRLSNGAIAPSAKKYTSAIVLPQGVTDVKARVKEGNLWSAMNPPRFYVAQSYADLLINEIMYRSDNICSPNFEEIDYLEIYNKGNQPIDLLDTKFTKGIAYEFEESITLAPGEYLILCENVDTFQMAYGFTPDGQYMGELDNNGEQIIYTDPLDQTIDSVRYNNKNPWDEAPDGAGTSLELLHPTFDNNKALNWFRSDNTCGTPGQANSRICNNPTLPIVINEINYNSDNENFDPGDWIELYNPNPTPVDLSGWTFYDNGNAFVLPSGTSISAAAYLVLVEEVASFTSAFPLVNTNVLIGDLAFTLSNRGERISLFDSNKCLVDYVIYNDKAPWPIAADGGGPTVALIDPVLDNGIAASWASSEALSTTFIHGSPGKSNLCAGGGHGLVSSQISTSADDAEENLANGSVTLSSGDLDMINDGAQMFMIGLRFQNITIPKGATITSAVIEFVADEVNTFPTNLLIQGEAIDNAASFSSMTNNISSRTRTTNSATWEPEPWETVGENDIHQKTVDLSNIIQEIVDRPGFSSGNAIALILEGTGIRTAESFNGNPADAPKLWITYSSGGCGLQAKLLLEGFYDAATEEMHTKLQDQGLLPMLQPFNETPWNYTGTEEATSFPSTAVDWVLVMSRNTDGTIIDQAAGFIDIYGNLLSIEGAMGIPIAGAANQHFSIHTRSHLAILSANPYQEGIYDFTTASTQAQGIDQLKNVSDKYVLYAGDYDSSGLINNADFNLWKTNSAKLNEYLSIDGDGNGIINSGDFNLWITNRSKIGEQVIRY